MEKNKVELDIFHRLAMFYIAKHGGDFNKAISEVELIGFPRAEVFGDNIVLWVNKPGLFIGPRGENIVVLEKYLTKKIYIKEVEGEPEDLIINAIQDERDLANPPPMSPYDRYADYETAYAANFDPNPYEDNE